MSIATLLLAGMSSSAFAMNAAAPLDLDAPMVTARNAEGPSESLGTPPPPQVMAAMTMQAPMTPAPVISSAPPPAMSPPVAAPTPGARRLNPTGRDISLNAPLKDGDITLGEVGFVLGADDSIRINSQDLLEVLGRLLQSGSMAQLQAAIAAERTVSTSRLAELGYQVNYDPAAITLGIVVPVESRVRRNLSLMDLRENNGTFDNPAKLSAYLNARGSFDYVHEGFNAGDGEALVLFDAAVRTRGVVLETEGSYQSAGDEPFRREGTRFVYDRLDRTERWTVGDLLPTGRGFSGSSTMAGISVLRSYSVLEPQRNVQPRGDRSFTVVRPSTVEAFVNGRSVRQIRLAPGTYDLRDFPFTQGTNNVRLVVTDDAGREEVTEFSLFFDRTLLEPGLAEYGFFAGAYAPFTATSREYDFSDPRASGFYRRGVNERLTAGANFNASKNGAVVGIEALWAAPFGTIGFDLAGSQHDGGGSGFAFNVGYSYVFQISDEMGANPAVAFTFETRSEDFATPDELVGLYPFKYEMGISYSQPIGERQYVALDARQAVGRGLTPDEEAYRIVYGNRLTERLNLQAEALHETRFGREESGVRIGLLYRIGPRTSASAEYDSRDERFRVGAQTSRGRGVGAWSASGDIDYSQGATGLNAGFSQTMNRFEYGLNHRTAFSADGGSISDARSSLRAATALVYADGKFGASRPIYDAFVMVAPHETIKDKTVIIEPEKDFYLARSDRTGPAILAEVGAFTPRTITYDVPDAPAGYDFGNGTTRVLPPYRSGYLTIAGSDYSKTAIGRLVNDEGEPVVLLAGKATEVGSDREPVLVFTNRDGRFGAPGLRAGTWIIEMPGDPPLKFKMVIPEDSQGVFRLGDLKPDETQ